MNMNYHVHPLHFVQIHDIQETAAQIVKEKMEMFESKLKYKQQELENRLIQKFDQSKDQVEAMLNQMKMDIDQHHHHHTHELEHIAQMKKSEFIKIEAKLTLQSQQMLLKIQN